ncbi:hypothetical protein FACS1894211_13010 [Clostridia bacterium]|nr:hypothetical protein FACS1894211_13010 [Clostridia bacterium]
MQIFYGSQFVGQTHIDPRRTDDVLKISLGRDKNVIVTRIKGRDLSGKTLFGGNMKASRSFELKARNAKSVPVELTLLDQIPVSTDKSVTVDANELSGAEHNKEKGELKWIVALKPGETVSKTVKYTVTYPAGVTIAIE